MDFELPARGGIGRPASTPPVRAVAQAPGPGAVMVNKVPASPPPHVLEQTYDSGRAAEKLGAQGRELHFEPAPGGQILVQVRDLAGNVLLTISPSVALDIATGAPLPGPLAAILGGELQLRSPPPSTSGQRRRPPT